MKYLLLLFFLIPHFCNAQSVGIGTPTPIDGKLYIEGTQNGNMLTMRHKKDSNGISFLANDFANYTFYNSYFDSTNSVVRRMSRGYAAYHFLDKFLGRTGFVIEREPGLGGGIVNDLTLPNIYHSYNGNNYIGARLGIDTLAEFNNNLPKLLIKQNGTNSDMPGIRIVQTSAVRPATIEMGNLTGNFWKMEARDIPSSQYFAIHKEGLGNPIYINSEGNVGIGHLVGNPARTLHVSGGSIGAPITTAALAVFEQDAGFNIQLSSPNNSQTGIISGNQNTSVRAGILFTADSAISFRAGGNNTRMFLSKTGNVNIDGVLTQNSDSRLKTNIHPLENSLQKILLLNGVQYEWKDTEREPGIHTGLLAQEVELLLPELVSEDEEGTKSVNYTALIPHLIESIKTQQKEIDILKEQLRKKSRKRK